MEMAVMLAAMMGAVIGYCGNAWLVGRRMNEVRKRTWAQAAMFYARKAEEEGRP